MLHFLKTNSSKWDHGHVHSFCSDYNFSPKLYILIHIFNVSFLSPKNVYFLLDNINNKDERISCLLLTMRNYASRYFTRQNLVYPVILIRNNVYMKSHFKRSLKSISIKKFLNAFKVSNFMFCGIHFSYVKKIYFHVPINYVP